MSQALRGLHAGFHQLKQRLALAAMAAARSHSTLAAVGAAGERVESAWAGGGGGRGPGGAAREPGAAAAARAAHGLVSESARRPCLSQRTQASLVRWPAGERVAAVSEPLCMHECWQAVCSGAARVQSEVAGGEVTDAVLIPSKSLLQVMRAPRHGPLLPSMVLHASVSRCRARMCAACVARREAAAGVLCKQGEVGQAHTDCPALRRTSWVPWVSAWTLGPPGAAAVGHLPGNTAY